MKPILIANPLAAGGRVGREISTFERAVADRFGPCDLRLSQQAGGVEHLVREAVGGGAELIGVVGGDGSIGEAVNGLLGDGCEVPAGFELLFLPSGTGGDFARVIGMSGWQPGDGLGDCSPRRIDVGCVELSGHDGEPVTRLFANIASTGASAVIAESVNQTSKKLGRFGFAVGTLKGLAAWRNRRIRLRVDDEVDREVDFNSVAIANGRCFGGGMKIAPDALLDDGLFDVVLVGEVGAGTFLRHGRKLYRGELGGIEQIEVRRAREVEVRAVEDGGAPIPVETDGEHPGFLPLSAAIVPRALTLLAPWERAAGVAPATA